MADKKKSAPAKPTQATPAPKAPKLPKQRTHTPRRKAIIEAREDLNRALLKVSALRTELRDISKAPVDTPEYLAKRAELTLAERFVTKLRERLAYLRAVPPVQTTHEFPQQVSVSVLERIREGLVNL